MNLGDLLKDETLKFWGPIGASFIAMLIASLFTFRARSHSRKMEKTVRVMGRIDLVRDIKLKKDVIEENTYDWMQVGKPAFLEKHADILKPYIAGGHGKMPEASLGRRTYEEKCRYRDNEIREGQRAYERRDKKLRRDLEALEKKLAVTSRD